MGVRFWWRRGRYLLLTVVLPALIAASVPAAEDKAIESRKRDLAEVEKQVRDLERNLAARRARRQELGSELERRERDIAELARAGHRLVAMTDKQEQVLGGLRSQLAVEREALGRERAALGGLLRSVYATGRGDHIRILLDQEDADQLSRIMAYYGFLNRFRMQRVKAVMQRARRLDDLMRETAEERARLVSLARKQEQTRTRLALVQGERSVLLTSLEQTIATRAGRIEELRAQAQGMRLLLEQLERHGRALPEAKLKQEPLQRLRGRLTWPLVGAPLLSRYGSLKEGGGQRWDGVVLKAEEGTAVRAVHYGRVVYADWLRGFGLLLIIEHDNDYMTLYGHNQTLLKEPGEWVATGDTIALSGRSGGRLAPGLYFAIRHRGRPLNPEQWCRHAGGPGRKSSAINPPSTEQTAISSAPARPSRRTGDRRVTDAHIYLPVTSR